MDIVAMCKCNGNTQYNESELTVVEAMLILGTRPILSSPSPPTQDELLDAEVQNIFSAIDSPTMEASQTYEASMTDGKDVVGWYNVDTNEMEADIPDDLHNMDIQTPHSEPNRKDSTMGVDISLPLYLRHRGFLTVDKLLSYGYVFEDISDDEASDWEWDSDSTDSDDEAMFTETSDSELEDKENDLSDDSSSTMSETEDDRSGRFL